MPISRTCQICLAVLPAVAIGVAPAGAQVNINAWRQSNEFRAMALQRELAADMPQDQSLMLGSHNTFNASNYPQGYLAPQHTYAITEQLHLGLRQIDLDIHDIPGHPGNLFISHARCDGAGYNIGDMDLGAALLEIRAWMNANPDEVITVNTEQHFRTADTPLRGQTLQLIELLFGNTSGNDRLIRPSELGTAFPLTHLRQFSKRSLNELRGMGRIIFFNIGGATGACEGHYIDDYPAQNVICGNGPGTVACGAGPSLRERRVWYYMHARNFAHDYANNDINENGVSDSLDIARGDAPDVNSNGVIDFYEQQYWDIQCIGARPSDCSDVSNFYSILYNNTSCLEYAQYGSTDPWVTREAVRAGMDVVRFDPLGTSTAGCSGDLSFVQPADEHMRATIWSWDYRYLPFADGTPLAAMAVIEGDSARIRWELPAANMRYALQNSFGEWAISQASGSFSNAPPQTQGGLNFRVPGNGFEMQNLFGFMVRAGVTKVWINYQDLNGDGAWQGVTQARTFYYETQPNHYEPTPRAETSAVPFIVTNRLQLSQAVAIGTPASGLVVPAYPGIYTATPNSLIRLNRPMTIVPAAHGVPVFIGR